MWYRLTVLVGLLAGLPTLAGGVSGRGGLEAVAVSPDGKWLAVGGQNRVVYIVDVSGTVRSRYWLGTRIGNLAFTQDGKRLLVEDEEDLLRVLDVATGKEIQRREGVRGLVYHSATNRIAIRDSNQRSRNRLWLLSADGLRDEGAIELAYAPVAYRFDLAGKQLLVLGQSRDSKDEPRIEPKLVPSELRGLARQVFRQKNDGLQAVLGSFEVPTGKPGRSQSLWYTSDSDSTLLVQSGEIRYILNRANVCARVDAEGTIRVFALGENLHHALGASPDGRVVLTGGLGEGTHGPIEGGRRERFELKRLPGQAEYLSRFAVADDGSAWVVTTASRLGHISKEGKVDRLFPVY